MRRRLGSSNTMEAFLHLLQEQPGMKRLLASMPPGSTLADARRLHRRLKQAARRPCGALDRELNIQRDAAGRALALAPEPGAPDRTA